MENEKGEEKKEKEEMGGWGAEGYVGGALLRMRET